MPKSFEAWATARISKLRSDADALRAEADGIEVTLKKYLNDLDRTGEAAVSVTTVVTANIPANEAIRGLGRVGPGSKSAGIEGYVVGTEDKGADLHEVYAFVKSRWPDTPTNITRSLLWHHKKSERLVLRGNRYYSPRYAPPVESGALLPEPTPGISGQA